MFFATSEDEPTFFVSAADIEDLCFLISAALERLYQSQHHRAIKAIPMGSFEHETPWAIVPQSLIAQLAAAP